jgi:hypothetical protein
MAKSHRYPNYTINADRPPKAEPKRTPAEKQALRERKARMDKLEDMEFCKKLGIFDLSDQVR